MPVITRFPTSNTAVSGTWSNPTNAYLSNGSVTSTTIAAKNTTADRQYGTFGFDSEIPSGATINSVAINVRHRNDTTAGVAFLENFASIGATAGAVNSDDTEPTTLTERTYSSYARPGGGTWTRADLLNSTFTATIRARSGNSATSVVYEWDYISVTVDYTEPDVTAPTVSTFSPANGATNVNPNSNIVLTFDESVARGTGTIEIRAGSAAGTLFESFNAATSGRITISGSTFTLDPTSNLADDTNYFVVIPSGTIKDLAGNDYAGTSTYNFTTGDYTAPTVTTFSPTGGATDASPSANVVLTFNENIARGTGTISIRVGSASGTVFESFNAATSDRITISGSTFTLDPTTNLDPLTNYFVVFPSGSVKDVAGNNWTGTSTYNFTTAAGAVEFPTSPTTGQTFAHEGRRWEWSGTAWERPLVSRLGDTMSGDLTAPTFIGALTGNASTATTLQTSRTINGTSFNGSANITTASWGAARTLTIGSTGKSVDGSAAVSWSLAEIGAGDVTLTGAQTLTNKTITEMVSVISTNTTATASTVYVLTASLTLTLPASPAVGAWVRVSNRSGTTTCVIARNSRPIMSLAENLTVDVIDAGFTLSYADATRGWVII
jgi:hypothetical protein